MSEEEMKIISHPLFNRLRKIKQNTFLYFVFPSANHTRFEHSIGVMHLASEMFINSFSNAGTLRIKQKKYGIGGNKNILDIAHFKNEDFITAFLDLRIAAILHDIGHGPMSHLFDEFAPKNSDFLSMVKYDEDLGFQDEFAKSLENIMKEKNKDLTKNHVEHEYVSYYFAAKVLTDLGFEKTRIKRILSIMNEQLNLETINLILDGDDYNLTPFLNQIVAGAPLDCDRMDYLLRDSYFSGVKYGTYDLNRLLKSLLPFIDIERKQIRLGIKKSGLPAIENFLQARYELYVQVYFHKTNQACNAMLSHATRKLRDKNYEFVKCNTPFDFISKYLNLSDERFLDDIYGSIPDDDDKETIEDLKNRKLWKRVIEVYPESEKMRKEDIKDQIINVLNWILNKDSRLKPFVTECLNSNDPLKDLNGNKAVLLKKDTDENYTVSEEGDWIENSIIFKALSKKYLVGRVYMRVKEDEQGKNLFRSLKQEIKKL
ncbi:HD domain-containing protein [Priestia megaterium]|uniref:HD domain-containing protein n=1 Tax=Priestia megaterium TaxID=1404 RepID=UPI00249A9693|nr:HD domain-containing protein [Priestia megaterium]MDI3091488.1 HD domain-containing protein [Priestia megaterium]